MGASQGLGQLNGTSMSFVNIEFKARCADADRVRRLLSERDAEFVGTDHQVDHRGMQVGVRDQIGGRREQAHGTGGPVGGHGRDRDDAGGSDHHVVDEVGFRTHLEAACLHAEATGRIVTLGIQPDRPETGYGYIRRGEEIDGRGVFRVGRFVEKPDLTTAQEYARSGDYYWNSGIFLMRADRWLEEIAKFRPDILQACQAAMADSKADSDFVRVDKKAFLASPSDSIDYAVMEKTDRAAVIPLTTPWSDVGCWSAVWEISERDSAGNVSKGDVLLHDSRNSLLLADSRCVAAVGLDDVIVIETADAVLVADKKRCQEVKAIVAAFQLAIQQEAKAREAGSRKYGAAPEGGWLDLDAARVEIRGRLACLRAAGAGGELSCGVE